MNLTLQKQTMDLPDFNCVKSLLKRRPENKWQYERKAIDTFMDFRRILFVRMPGLYLVVLFQGADIQLLTRLK